MKHVYEICLASERVTSIMCGLTKGTDTNRALRIEWTGPGRKGLETLHMRQKALLDARAAGIDYPLAGPYVDIDDHDGLTEDMEFTREMGYEGYVVIHLTLIPPTIALRPITKPSSTGSTSTEHCETRLIAVRV